LRVQPIEKHIKPSVFGLVGKLW